MDLLFSCLLAYYFFISLFLILEGKKERNSKFFLARLSQNEFRESRERWWMKQSEERVLNYTYQSVAYGRDESEVMAEENLGTQRKEKVR